MSMLALGTFAAWIGWLIASALVAYEDEQDRKEIAMRKRRDEFTI